MATHFSGPIVSTNGFTGDLTGNVTGNLTGNVIGNITGKTTFPSAVVAAAGSGQSTYAALSSQINAVTGANGTLGVALPAAVAGEDVFIYNTSQTQSLPVAPVNGGNDQINSLTVGTGVFTMGPGRAAWFTPVSAVLWYVSGDAAIVGTPTEQDMDGLTATTAELNKVDADTAGGLNQTSTACTLHKHNLSVGAADVTASAAEVNTLASSGITNADLVKVHAVTATALEINTAVDTVVKWWVSSVETLQALITGITDATAAKQYTIMIPPGYYEAAALGTTPLLLKPFINLKGAGGRGRITVFHNIGLSLLDAAMTTGTQRLRMDGIRFETCPLIFTAASHTMSVILDDCPVNNASSIAFTGTSYASRSALEIRNLNIDNNTTSMLYKFAQVSFWNSTLLGLYFEDADAYFFGCDIAATCNAVNAGVAGGWFEFNNCKIDQMTVGDPASESVLATFGVGGSENIQVHGAFTGETAPGSVAAFIRMRAGTQYFCHNDAKLYVKTADVGTNTWAIVGAQA
jgi:hypothetical protein